MVERIQEIMSLKELSSTQFADNVEVPRAVISHILSGRNKPSLEVVTKIASAFPDISLSWILLGEGEMLKQLVDPVASIPKKNADAANGGDSTGIVDDTILQIDKVQTENTAPAPVIPDEQPSKAIEQIVIFYSDKTFTAYKP